MATLRDDCARHARASGTAVALAAPDRPDWTYARLARGLDRAGATLAELGYGRASRIATALPNDRTSAAMLLAGSTWAALAPLDARLDAPQARRLFEAMRIDALAIAPDGADAPVAQAARDAGLALLVVTPAADGDDDLFALSTSHARSAVSARAPTSDDIALLVPTSGTTGVPRVVAMSHAVLEAGGRRTALTAHDRVLALSPLSTSSGFGVAITVPLKVGATSMIVPGYDERAFFGWLASYRPTYYSASPTVHAAIADALARRGERLPPCVRFVRSSSNGMTAALQARIETMLGVPVIQGYGSTEGGLIAHDEPPPARRKPGTVGRPIADVRIVDDAGRELPVGSEGEIVVRGAAVVRGYENDEAATRESFRDGAFHTGDVGRLDDDGYLSITGRIKEMINRGGLKVAPAAVDAVLLSHADVQDAATVGIPHRSLGEDVVAAVILKPGATADAEALRRHAREKLAPHQAPSRVVIVDALPRGALGKVRRAELAATLEQMLRAAYVAPRDDDERIVADVIADVLALPRVGAHDHFFELGGDSLSSAQVLARIASRTGVALNAAALFDAPTVEQLARAIDGARKRAVSAEPLLVRRERRPAP
ncbi:MAG: AMP-binding protein [Vicinamibacteria bacterium]|jgi:acyl-CoA synthetase (AMP-forming)/AMP-acid ligase II/acyl carrier protein